MVLCKSVLRPRFLVSLRFFFPFHGLPPCMPRFLLKCILARTPSIRSICHGGMLLYSFCLQAVSSSNMSIPSRIMFSGSYSMLLGAFSSSSSVMSCRLNASAASNSIAVSCCLLSTTDFPLPCMVDLGLELPLRFLQKTKKGSAKDRQRRFSDGLPD